MSLSSATAFDASSTHSQGGKSASSKRRWRDMGLTGSASAGLANLMRSARKSTDSLRSATSSASRSRSKRANASGDMASAASRPRSSQSSVHKDLPGLPSSGVHSSNHADEADGRRSSSVSSGIIHDVPEDTPLEFYEMPEADDGDPLTANVPSARAAKQDEQRDVKTPTNEYPREHKRDTITQQSARDPNQLERTNSIVSSAAPLMVASRSTSLTNTTSFPSSKDAGQSYSGWTTQQVDGGRDDGAKTPTGDDIGDQTPSQQRIGSTARSLARKSFSRLRRKSTATEEGRPSFSSNVRSDITQSNGGSERPPLPPPSFSTRGPHPSSLLGAGTQWASDKVGGGDGNTIAQLYAVFGLPKDPSVWTLAEEDCVTGVHHLDGAINRFWRPEVLGCSICPSPSDVNGGSTPGDRPGTSAYEGDENGTSKWEGRKGGAESKKAQSPKFIEMSDGRGSSEKTETARVLSKALKLSFTREVEIVAEQGHYPPKASSHTFSFSVPTVASGDSHERTGDGRKAAMATGVSVGMANAANGVGEGYGLTSQRRNATGMTSIDGQDGPRLATFYGVALTVWSAADEKRAKVIRKELTRAAKQRGGQLNPSKSAASGVSHMKSDSGGGEAGGWGEANNENDQSLTAIASSPDTVFFMPYAICIVSRFPLYNLLGDWNKMAWHKYSRNIEMHNQLMSTILRHPAPRLGEEVSVGSPDKDVSFHCIFPGAVEWGTGLIGVDFAMWPLFNALSLENILTICEIALGHNGRVLFISRHPAMLGMAVETIQYLVEQSGWRGIAHQNCHARDVRIYLEDPGSWIIGINTELRGLIQPAKEVCVVDVDLNRVQCVNPPLHAISKGAQRDKRRRRIAQAVLHQTYEYSPPREFVDAYPGGRLRPLSRMVTRETNSAYEQLTPPQWWNQAQAIQAFDAALREGQKSSFFKKVLSGNRRSSKIVATPSETAAISALRKRASTFVDARDGLENKIGRLNKRLAFLMSESEMWRAQFSKIQTLVDRLTKEANDLRGKVDKERRESKRLSSRLAERDIEQVQIQLQLKETESAREEAIAELHRMKAAMESVEQERESMMDEIRQVLAGGGNIDDVNLSVTRLDLPSFGNSLSRASSPTGSQASMTPSQAADYILKSRAMAEARISEGRPGRTRSRNLSRTNSAQGSMLRSLSQDRGERNRKASFTGSSQANHFTDEQMNYEIQQRTSMVTNQISRIQQQLESTLTNLEGRRSGTYERESERRRVRRSSNASMNSVSRYEYRGSSVGHGGADSVSGFTSDDGHVRANGTEDGAYEMVENVGSQTPKGTSRRRRDRSNVAPPTASSQSLREAYAAGSNASQSSTPLLGKPQQQQQRDTLPPPIAAASKALARRSDTNEWKTLPTSPTDSTIKATATDATPPEPLTPSAEVVNSPTTATPLTEGNLLNGVAAQPLLSALPYAQKEADSGDKGASVDSPLLSQAKGSPTALSNGPLTSAVNHVNGNKVSTSANGEWQAQSAPHVEGEGNANGGTSPLLASATSNGGVGVPESEVMISQAGWKLESNGKSASGMSNTPSNGTANRETE